MGTMIEGQTEGQSTSQPQPAQKYPAGQWVTDPTGARYLGDQKIPTTPASEVDARTDADIEEAESHRVTNPGTEAWQTFVGDSEAARDYTPRELGIELDSPFGVLAGDLRGFPDELTVETVVCFPDGRRVTICEARETSSATDHDALELVRKVSRLVEYRFQTDTAE